MLETSARLLRLLTVLQGRPSWSGAELADRLEVTGRTVRRDVERLRSLGYPVHATAGAGGGYRLGAGGALPPLLLDDDEAVAVVAGLRMVADGTVAGFAEASLGALTKLEQVMPTRLRHRVATLREATVTIASVAPTLTPESLLALAAACRVSERVRIAYRDRAGTATDRRIDPYRLVHSGQRWYLVAYDADREAWRTFRVDRIRDVTPTGRRTPPPDPPDAAAFVAEATTSAPYRYQARILLHATATAIAERVTPASVTVEVVDEQRCMLTAGADSLDAILWSTLGLGVGFTVLEPTELITRMRELAATLTAAAHRP